MRRGLKDLLADELGSDAREVPIAQLHANPNQPRRTFRDEGLDELADSIRRYGILNPIVVRLVSDGRYEIVAGERRFRAATRAGLTKVPVTIRHSDDRETLEMSIVENVQREDIDPVECALAYRRLADEFGLKQDEIAAKVGKSRAAIANTMRLLKLEEPILDAIREGSLSEGGGRALLQIEDRGERQRVFRLAVKEGWNVRRIEHESRADAPVRRKTSAREPSEIERTMSEAIGLPVTVVGTTVTIRCGDLDGVDLLLEKLGVVP